MGTTLTAAQHVARASLASPTRQQVALSPHRSPQAVVDVAEGLVLLKSRRNSSSSQRRCNSPVRDGMEPVPFSDHSSLTKGKALQSRTFHSCPVLPSARCREHPDLPTHRDAGSVAALGPFPVTSVGRAGDQGPDPGVCSTSLKL